MKPILEYLYNRKGAIISNKFGVTKRDCIDKIKGLPLGILIYALEEQERRNGIIDLNKIQTSGIFGAFVWKETKDGHSFWEEISDGNYDKFYKKYPEYKKYDI